MNCGWCGHEVFPGEEHDCPCRPIMINISKLWLWLKKKIKK